MNSVEALVELIVEAKSLNRNDSRLSYLRNEIEKDLENVEEEIGIDLIKAVKLCKQVNRNKIVYTKEKWGIDTLELLDELDIELFNHRLYGNERGIYVSLDLYNYGITWALTKEELEQDE